MECSVLSTLYIHQSLLPWSENIRWKESKTRKEKRKENQPIPLKPYYSQETPKTPIALHRPTVTLPTAPSSYCARTWRPLMLLSSPHVFTTLSWLYFNQAKTSGAGDLSTPKKTPALSSSEKDNCDLVSKEHARSWVFEFSVKDKATEKLRKEQLGSLLLFRQKRKPLFMLAGGYYVKDWVCVAVSDGGVFWSVGISLHQRALTINTIL